ncbi:MAG: hypothetical protein V4819_01485 [Verrucomicrobiota bacterium]
MTTTSILDRHPLDHAVVLKLALSAAATAALAASGSYHLLITAPSDATTPSHLQGRRIMHALPLTQALANDLFRVASGTHKATRKSAKGRPTPGAL